jgi:endonuclease/exonuclease/phosphatase family metal-dependent hydrolase
LKKRKYKVVHQDTKDERGIDIAFIYDDKIFTLDKKPNLFSLEIMKRHATRNILQVNFKTRKKGNPVILIGNHWPSRSGGQYESEPFRMMAAETLSYWLQRIQDIYGEQVPVMVMGDFNDEPFNRSLREYALSVNNTQKVLRGRNPYLFNLMHPLLGKGKGTIEFDGSALIVDQLMVTKGFISTNSPIQVDAASTNVVTFPEMVNKNGAPIRFGRPSQKSTFNLKGYSDHFPISTEITEK